MITGQVEHPAPDLTELKSMGVVASQTYASLPSSLNSIAPKANFTVFPNPAHDFINITSDQNEQINTIQLFNISGQQLRTWQSINDSNFEINVDDLSAGIYLVKIELENGTIGAKRVVIN